MLFHAVNGLLYKKLVWRVVLLFLYLQGFSGTLELLHDHHLTIMEKFTDTLLQTGPAIDTMISNSNDQDFTTYNVMRACFAHWSNGIIRDPHGLGGPGQNIARNNGDYNAELDWVRAAGRGIAVNRTSYFYNKTIWMYDGEYDWQDLRHNREVGNWMEMEDFKYNNRKSDCYGQNYQLYATEDYVDPSDPSKVLVHKGDILCSDTIRNWYPTPLYQVYILDTPNENNMGANQFQGASGKGANGDMYLFRLAETYLLRAEARLLSEERNRCRRRRECRT